MNKSIMLILIMLISLVTLSNFALGIDVNSVSTFGGNTVTAYEYDLDIYCVDAFVNVSATKDIEFTKGGTREYDLKNCEFDYSQGLRFDSWTCTCTNGEFDLVLSTLINTINTYSFSIGFTYEEDELTHITETETTTTQTTRTSRRYSTILCITQWTCTAWSECVDGMQTRTCSYPDNFCEPEEDMPELTRSCVITTTSEDEDIIDLEDEDIIEFVDETDSDEINRESEPQRESSAITSVTGLATGAGIGNAVNWFAIVLLIGLISWFIFGIRKKKKKK